MFRAEICWLASGPTLKMEGKLVGDWAEQARSLVTPDVVPSGLIVDLTYVSYIDPVGEEFLKWLASVDAIFVANNVYASAVCDRLGLSLALGRPKRQHGGKEAKSSIAQCRAVEVS